MKITATINESREMTGLGKTTIYKAIGEGRIATTLIGRRRLVNVESLRQFVSAS
ncbi:MAG: helix-turn-helix domain-containing protein [Sphingomicrobium sp.]|nr:helix-turn-helix domain-containing protein [Sphingomonadales bacterium]